MQRGPRRATAGPRRSCGPCEDGRWPARSVPAGGRDGRSVFEQGVVQPGQRRRVRARVAAEDVGGVDPQARVPSGGGATPWRGRRNGRGTRRPAAAARRRRAGARPPRRRRARRPAGARTGRGSSPARRGPGRRRRTSAASRVDRRGRARVAAAVRDRDQRRGGAHRQDAAGTSASGSPTRPAASVLPVGGSISRKLPVVADVGVVVDRAAGRRCAARPARCR